MDGYKGTTSKNGPEPKEFPRGFEEVSTRQVRCDGFCDLGQVVLQAPSVQKTILKQELRQSWSDALPQTSLGDKTDQDIKYQNITYYKCDGKTVVKSSDHARIELPRAISEVTELGHGGYDHFIGFVYEDTNECLQFAHYYEHDWYADVPINPGIDWDGYYWGCHTDLESVLNTVRLFFEAGPWFDSLRFTMRRYKG